MQFKEIRSLIKKECKEKGIKFYQGRKATVKHSDGVGCNGYFYDAAENEHKQPILAIATNENSLDVLIHEYCHMQQFLENSPEWEALKDGNEIWDWLSGRDDIADEDIDRSLLAYYYVEVDCEKRAVEQHKIWNTGKNLEEYIQKANAYTLFYFYVRANRKWYVEGREPYNLKDVWSHMPKNFTFDVQACYNKVYELFDQCV